MHSTDEHAGLPLLEMNDINLNLNHIRILKNVDLEIHSGQIHAIVGHHGAGKSSLAMIANGLLKPDAGKLLVDGKTYNKYNFARARKLGMEMVYQQIHLLDYFTVAENLLIPDKLTRGLPFLYKKRLIQTAGNYIARYGLDLDPRKVIKNMELSKKMAVYILRSIIRTPRLLILDEALEKLAADDYRRILDILITLKTSGMAIVLITHRIDDIFQFADRVTILKNGRILLTDSVNHIDRINLIKMSYIQITNNQDNENINYEFYQMLKYNEAILQKLPLNFIVADNNHRIKMINEYGQHYFNLKSGQYLNLPVETLFMVDNKEAYTLIEKGIRAGKEQEFYNVPLTLKQHKTLSNIKIFPIYDGAFLIGNIIIIEDISKQEDLRQQVILSEKLASVGLLAAGVAHEINNPLEIIYNYLNFLRYNPDKTALQDTLQSLEEEMESIKQIVSNLILFSDSQKTSMEEFDINELICSIINLIKFKTRKMNITINFISDHDSIFYRANKNEIKQVVLNLLKNSIEAMPEGGTIDIRSFSRRTGDFAEIGLVIFDSGSGIAAKDSNHIFLPFYSTKKRSSNNLGLGLSVSYGIIKKYKGKIAVKNRESAGCEFTITLPVIKGYVQDVFNQEQYAKELFNNTNT